MYYLKGHVITEGKIMTDRFVEVTGDTITYIGDQKRHSNWDVFDVADGYICPGLIDIHIHGVGGFDFMDHASAFTEITERLPKRGVTSLLATSRTGALNDIEALLQAARARIVSQDSKVAQLLGVHLEGPWISQHFSGAQPKHYIRPLTWSDVERVIEPFKDVISMITLAPEEVDDPTIISYLSREGINVSAGHTRATIDEIEAAIDHGLKLTTHTFNAMSPIHHRNPGTAAAALYYDALTCEVIADGLHVHPKVIDLLYKNKGKERMMLISDSTGYDHLEDGQYYFREKHIVKKGNTVTLDNGTLAGSAITLDKGLKYIVENCSVPLEDAVYMATEGPLNALGLSHLKKGRITEGYLADIIMLDVDLNLKKTIIKGEVVYSAEV
ncbi:N-acetylglucosamine-6-phosphate deacetylase [Lentibacillus saliphilus]|uniref:N-acetylglucosamine-6-phosphate deacetylase n=1 Tax=Lentibacillus saliphilus TaxID=2737028 RepID=UPI001C2F63AB|nr:N-acetylglucosamine-6-phosphate deacetylase [Lentibacillus saliphilus]